MVSKLDRFGGVAALRARKFVSETLSRRMVGFTLSKAWVCLAFLSPALLVGEFSQTSLDYLNNVSRAALIVTLLVGGLALNRLFPKAKSAWLAGATAPAAVGTVLVPFSSSFGDGFLFAASVLTGVGSGLLLLQWGYVYRVFSAPVVAAEACVVFSASTLVAPACVLFPVWTNVILALLCLLGSSAMLSRELSNDEGADEEGAPSDLLYDKRATLRLLAKISVASVALGAVLSVLRAYCESGYLLGSEEYRMVTLVVPAILAGAIVLAVLLFSRNLDLAFSYKPVLVLLAVGCFLLPLSGVEKYVPYLFGRTGYVCFTILAWVMLSDLSCRGTLPSFTVFGIGQASCSVGLATGSGVAMFANGGFAATMDVAFSISGVLVLVLIVVYAFFLTERDVSRAIKRPEPELAAGDEDEGAGPSGMQDSGERVQPSSREDRCRELARRHGLGERAVEVLVLYAKGRSRSRISQELYIAQGTVSYHLRNIYLSLGVHSRQELLDLIDGAADSSDVDDKASNSR